MASDKAASRSDLSAPVPRRAVPGGLSLLPPAAALPDGSADPAYRFLTPHQAAVLDAATRRLLPGPPADPLELGHPGIHEAQVVTYLDRLLGDVPAGAPWNSRGGSSERIAELRSEYSDGIALLDQHAGGNFTAVSPLYQDLILGHTEVASFTSLLFGHTIEAMYALPEYGGNAGLVGSRDIRTGECTRRTTSTSSAAACSSRRAATTPPR